MSEHTKLFERAGALYEPPDLPMDGLDDATGIAGTSVSRRASSGSRSSLGWSGSLRTGCRSIAPRRRPFREGRRPDRR